MIRLIWISALTFGIFFASVTDSRAQEAFDVYNAKIDVVNDNLDEAFQALYDKNNRLRIRFGQRTGAFAQNAFRRIGLGPNEPAGLLVRPVHRAHRLMFEIAVSEQLTDQQKDELLNRLTDEWSNTVGDLMDDYVDPMDRSLLTAHLRIPEGESPVGNFFSRLAKFGVKYGSRLAWGVIIIPRDVMTSMVPYSPPSRHSQSNGYQSRFYRESGSFSRPRAAPIVGEDTIRSQNGHAIAKDIRRTYNKAISAAKSRHHDRKKEIKERAISKEEKMRLIEESKETLLMDMVNVRIALMRLHHESSELEPIRDGDLHALSMMAYDISLVVISVFFAQFFAIEPTLTGAFWWTALVWVPLFKGLLQNLRRNNSGYGFFRKMRFLRYPEKGFVGRMGLRARFFFEKLKIVFSDQCEFHMKPIARAERSFAEARRAAGMP